MLIVRAVLTRFQTNDLDALIAELIHTQWREIFPGDYVLLSDLLLSKLSFVQNAHLRFGQLRSVAYCLEEPNRTALIESIAMQANINNNFSRRLEQTLVRKWPSLNSEPKTLLRKLLALDEKKPQVSNRFRPGSR